MPGCEQLQQPFSTKERAAPSCGVPAPASPQSSELALQTPLTTKLASLEGLLPRSLTFVIIPPPPPPPRLYLLHTSLCYNWDSLALIPNLLHILKTLNSILHITRKEHHLDFSLFNLVKFLLLLFNNILSDSFARPELLFHTFVQTFPSSFPTILSKELSSP